MSTLPSIPSRTPRRLGEALAGALALGSACALNGHAAEAFATASGSLHLDRLDCVVGPTLALPDWQFRSATADASRAKEGQAAFRLDANPQGMVRGSASLVATRTGEVEAQYLFLPEQDVSLAALFVGATFPAHILAGGSWSVGDGRGGTVPARHGAVALFAGTTTSLGLETPAGLRIAFAFPEPTEVLLQDDRQWGPSFSVRIGHSGAPRTFKAREPFTLRCTVSTQEPLRLEWDAPVTLQAGPDWIPFHADADILPGSALDFSALGLAGAPAGRYGRVVARGPHFEFERLPGVPQRFYGVNVCFTANFLDPPTAGRLADRLARIGYNAIRLHHHDGGLVAGSADGTTPGTDPLARMDALVAACVARGLYLTTDLFVSRPVPWKSVGIERDGTIPMNTFKMLVPVHEGAFENLRDFTRQWLSHVNPETGRSLAAEPALGWISLINEGNFGNYAKELRSIPEWKTAWVEWLSRKREQSPAAFAGIPAEIPVDFFARDRHAAAFALFLADTEARFVGRMRSFLRDELGCRALLSNQNAWTFFVSDQLVRHAQYDYADDHFYVDHPSFPERPWTLPSQCANANPIRNEAMGAQGVVFTRLLDKPFTVTEYNYSAPGRFRGVGGIVAGTLAALQDWSGLWRFAFRHSAGALQGSTVPCMNYFDMAGDPLSLAAERASLCLFLRRDLVPLRRSYALLVPKALMESPPDQGMPRNRAAWSWMAWFARVGTQVADVAPDATWSGRFPGAYEASSDDLRVLLQPDPAAPLPAAGDGAVRLDAESGTFVIQTPRTCGGFAEAGTVEAGSLSFDLAGAAATVWVSALDNAPIVRSSRLLLTHLTDVQNSGIRYAERSRKTLLDWGTLPHLVRNGQARVRIALEEPGAYAVHALSTSGQRVAPIPSRVEGGCLAFTADVAAVPETATMLYEIVRHPGDTIDRNR